MRFGWHGGVLHWAHTCVIDKSSPCLHGAFGLKVVEYLNEPSLCHFQPCIYFLVGCSRQWRNTPPQFFPPNLIFSDLGEFATLDRDIRVSSRFLDFGFSFLV